MWWWRTRPSAGRGRMTMCWGRLVQGLDPSGCSERDRMVRPRPRPRPRPRRRRDHIGALLDRGRGRGRGRGRSISSEYLPPPPDQIRNPHGERSDGAPGPGRGRDRAIATCTTCPTLCRWSCPVAEAEARETTSPQRLVVLAGFMKSGKVPVESGRALPYHCSQCGACTEACLHRNDVPMVLAAARSRVMGAGARLKRCGRWWALRGLREPQGTSLEPALDAVLAETGHKKVRGGEHVYFPGCSTLELMPEAAVGFLRATSLSGLSDLAVRPSSASCCGLPLFWAGELEGFRGHAARFAGPVHRGEAPGGARRACAHAPHPPLPAGRGEVRARGGPRDPLPHGRPAGPRRRGQHQGAPGGAAGLRGHLPPGPEAGPDGPGPAAHRQAVPEAGGGAGRGHPPGGGLLRGQRPAALTAPETAHAMAEARLEAFRRSGAAQLAVASPRCAAHLKSVDPTAPVVDMGTLLGASSPAEIGGRVGLRTLVIVNPKSANGATGRRWPEIQAGPERGLGALGQRLHRGAPRRHPPRPAGGAGRATRPWFRWGATAP
jgi:hypothetical protein